MKLDSGRSINTMRSNKHCFYSNRSLFEPFTNKRACALVRVRARSLANKIPSCCSCVCTHREKYTPNSTQSARSLHFVASFHLKFLFRSFNCFRIQPKDEFLFDLPWDTHFALGISLPHHHHHQQHGISAFCTLLCQCVSMANIKSKEKRREKINLWHSQFNKLFELWMFVVNVLCEEESNQINVQGAQLEGENANV